MVMFHSLVLIWIKSELNDCHCVFVIGEQKNVLENMLHRQFVPHTLSSMHTFRVGRFSCLFSGF